MNTLCPCGKSIFWAKHERTGKSAPLVRPPEGVKPNIAIKTNDASETVYFIVKSEEAEFISHYVDCPQAGRFRSEAVQRAADLPSKSVVKRLAAQRGEDR